MDPTDQYLIELIEKCTHLYDKNSPDYKDKIKTKNSWCSIAKLLNATVADCEHRWAQLRERFIRERRILKIGLPSGSESSKQLIPSNLYTALQFLEPHVQSRRTRGNILKRSISSTDDHAVSDTLEIDDPDVFEYLKNVEDKNKCEAQMPKEPEGDLLKIKMESSENNANLLNVKTSIFSKTFTDIENNKKRKTAVSAEDDTLQIVSEALQSVKGLCESTDKSDDVAYNFCMTMYSQLKNMSKKKQKIARSRINTIMLELESDSE